MNLFVYGSLRKGFGNHRLLEGCKYMGDDKVSGYTMYDLGAFPAISPDSKGIVTVEIYEITPKVLERTDMLEGYPGFYNRKEVETVNGIKGYIYFLNRYTRASNLVPGGDWKQYKPQYSDNNV